MRASGTSAVIMAMCTGLGSAVALSGYDVFWIAWIAWAPLLVAVRLVPARGAFGLGFIAGVVQTLGTLHWMPSTVAYMGKTHSLGAALLLLLCLLWGCQMGAFALLARFTGHVMGARRSRVAADVFFVMGVAGLWVGLEFVSARLLDATPWLSFCAGYSQWNHPLVIQVAALAGVHGVSFVVAACNAACAQCLLQRRGVPLATCAILLLVTVSYGVFNCRTAPEAAGDTVRVAILQGNIDPWLKLDAGSGERLARRYLDLNSQAAHAGAQLIVWTESAIPWPLESDDDLMETALRITAPAGATHLVGAPVASPNHSGKYHNAVLLVQPDGRITGQYNKVRPLVLAETPVQLPGQDAPVKIHPTQADYVKGSNRGVVASAHGKIGINICNENFHAGLVRAAVKKGAAFLVNVTNDGWLPSDWALRQHFAINVFRAVETRRAMVVANNVGTSALIDRCGRPYVTSAMRTPACLVGNLAPSDTRGFYAVHGDVFAGLCTCFSLGLVAWIPIRKKQEGGAEQ